MLSWLRAQGTAALAGAGATVGLLQTYGLPVRYNRGPEGRWWEPVRRAASRTLGRVDERAGPRPVTAGEYAGAFDGALAECERLLYARGFVRNPFSRLKLRAGRPEVGSWVRRDGPLARRQLHVMLFAGHGDGVDVYAHEELSSVNPLVGAGHFDGTDQRVAVGVERTRTLLPLDAADATADPPAGAWDPAQAE